MDSENIPLKHAIITSRMSGIVPLPRLHGPYLSFEGIDPSKTEAYGKNVHLHVPKYLDIFWKTGHYKIRTDMEIFSHWHNQWVLVQKRGYPDETALLSKCENCKIK